MHKSAALRESLQSGMTPLRFRLGLVLAASILLCLIGSTRAGDNPSAHTDLVHASLLADVDAVIPRTFTLGVRLKIAPHFHTYWINPGEFGNPTRIQLSGPPGFEFGEIQWPVPTRLEHAGGVTFGYEDEVVLMIPVKVAASVPTTGAAKIVANVSWLACDNDACIEGAAKLDITLPLGDAANSATAALLNNSWLCRLPISKDLALRQSDLSDVVQSKAPDGSPMPLLDVKWKTAPAKVEWFPIATSAIAIDNIVIKHDGTHTVISYKPTVYKPDQIAGGKIDSVLVYEDGKGLRLGITIPIQVKKSNNAK